MEQSMKSQQIWLTHQNSDPHAEDIAKYKSKSTSLNRSKWELFPTINHLPKKLTEVERCYQSLARTARQSKDKNGDEFDMIKQALKDKIAEKHREALELRKQESKVRWAVEREVKLKQKMEEERLLREQIERNEAEVYQNVTQRRKTRLLQEAKKHRHSPAKSIRSNTVTDVQNPQPVAKASKSKPKKSRHPKRSQSQSIRAELHLQQIQTLKGQLRDQCVDILQKEDNINSFLLAFRRRS